MSSNIQQVPVRVERGKRNAMIEAVAEHRIDVVICWPLWPETFCYVVHEALAGGAFIVTRAAAGNVWPVVMANAPDQGRIVEDETGLFALFQNGALLHHLNGMARCRGVLLAGQGTADWLNSKSPNEQFRCKR
jgi:hypothetical protein